jgi:hypothetical protein
MPEFLTRRRASRHGIPCAMLRCTVVTSVSMRDCGLIWTSSSSSGVARPSAGRCCRARATARRRELGCRSRRRCRVEWCLPGRCAGWRSCRKWWRSCGEWRSCRGSSRGSSRAAPAVWSACRWSACRGGGVARRRLLVVDVLEDAGRLSRRGDRGSRHPQRSANSDACDWCQLLQRSKGTAPVINPQHYCALFATCLYAAHADLMRR